MITQLLNILKEAIRRVPSMKYALAVAGLLAVVGLVRAFRISPSIAAFGAVIILVLMVAMVIFAGLTKVGPTRLLLPAQVMMWSFLLVTVATAFLLFTCAFFRWPKPLNEIVGGGGDVTNGPMGQTNSRPTGRVKELIEGAQLQLKGRDYPGAWRLITEALALAPDSKEARSEQVEIALAWLRDMRVTLPATFTDAVRPLVDCLYVALPQEKGTRAADIHAHIGWANALKWKGVTGQRIEEEYAEAVKLDPTNPFAHAMWGHWLATQRKPLAEIRNHFNEAHKSGRARAFVAYLQIYALGWDRDDLERARDMVRLADVCRRENIDPGEEARNKLFDIVYVGQGRTHDAEIIAVLPVAEHFATFQWVTRGRNLNDSGAGAYFNARLTEASGDRAKALSMYQAIKFSLFDEQIKAGMARCQK